MYDSLPSNQYQSNEVVPYSRYSSQAPPSYNYSNQVSRQSSNNVEPIKPSQGEGLITTKLVIGLLVGLVLCGIPLAVMSVLYVQAKQTSNNASSSNSGSTSGSNSTTLPSQCTSHSILADQFRLATSTACCYAADCSGNLATAWYRITSPGGTQLATSPISTGFCGQSYPAWFNGTYPTTPGTTVTGVTCTNYGGTICSSSYATTVSITNCNGFYVFYLTPFSICNIRYCTI